eukprot:1053930-Amphidinium_carterae.1
MFLLSTLKSLRGWAFVVRICAKVVSGISQLYPLADENGLMTVGVCMRYRRQTCSDESIATTMHESNSS